jgi:lysophospholipase L1-like esterase
MSLLGPIRKFIRVAPADTTDALNTVINDVNARLVEVDDTLANAVASITGYVKAPVACATMWPITLSGLQTIDGYSAIAGDRVLVKDQATGSANGIYVVAAGAWARATDFDASSEAVGAVVMVLNGLRSKGALYRQTASPVTLGATALTFTRDGGGLSFDQAINLPVGIVSQVGDSNTDDVAGRPGWAGSYAVEWFGTNGRFEGWTNYNIGANGSQLGGSWLSGVSAGSPATAVTTRGNPWAAINANPHLIILSLGTNDFALNTVRATLGVPATFKANLARLITFFLAGSKAAIWLRMPQPFAYESFTGVAWADANEAALYSSYLRDAYLEWVGVSDRVVVFDSHGALFGTRIDDKAANALDPVTGAPMMADSLHPTDLGFKRMCQYMTRQITPGLHRLPKFTCIPSSIVRAAQYMIPVRVETLEVGNTLLTIRPEPTKLMYGGLGDFTGSNTTTPVLDYSMLTTIAMAAKHGGLLGDLLSLHTATVKIYFPGTGNTYAPTTFRFSTTAVVGGGESADKYALTGTTVPELGFAVIYVESPLDNPKAFDDVITVNVERTTPDIIVPFYGRKGLKSQLIGVDGGRIGFAGIPGGFDVYQFSANAGVVTGTLAFTAAFSAGLALNQAALNTTNFPTGVVMDTRLPTTPFGFRLTNFSGFGGAGTPGTVRLHIRYLTG